MRGARHDSFYFRLSIEIPNKKTHLPQTHRTPCDLSYTPLRVLLAGERRCWCMVVTRLSTWERGLAQLIMLGHGAWATFYWVVCDLEEQEEYDALARAFAPSGRWRRCSSRCRHTSCCTWQTSHSSASSLPHAWPIACIGKSRSPYLRRIASDTSPPPANHRRPLRDRFSRIASGLRRGRRS